MVGGRQSDGGARLRRCGAKPSGNGIAGLFETAVLALKSADGPARPWTQPHRQDMRGGGISRAPGVRPRGLFVRNGRSVPICATSPGFRETWALMSAGFRDPRAQRVSGRRAAGRPRGGGRLSGGACGLRNCAGSAHVRAARRREPTGRTIGPAGDPASAGARRRRVSAVSGISVGGNFQGALFPFAEPRRGFAKRARASRVVVGATPSLATRRHSGAHPKKA